MSQVKKRDFKADHLISLRNTTDEDMTLMQFVLEKFPETSRTTIKSWLRHDNIRVDGVITTQFDYPVSKGALVEISPKRSFAQLKNPRLHLIYEDNDVIVVNKGYGLLSVGTESKRKQETAYNILKEYVKQENPGNKIFVVHRLDRGTSGLMMFAKNIEAKEALQHNWKNMVLQRKYVAVVEGRVEKESGMVKSFLNETSQFEMYSSANKDEGKLAITKFKVLKRGHNFTLMEFELETGRKNQIRIHCKDIEHPIAGDRKYGATSSPINRIALHALSLRFVHPATRKLMNFELPIPNSFLSLTKK